MTLRARDEPPCECEPRDSVVVRVLLACASSVGAAFVAEAGTTLRWWWGRREKRERKDGA